MLLQSSHSQTEVEDVVWSVQTNHHTYEARVARPFNLTYNPQQIEWERGGVGLAGQTSAQVYFLQNYHQKLQ